MPRRDVNTRSEVRNCECSLGNGVAHPVHSAADRTRHVAQMQLDAMRVLGPHSQVPLNQQMDVDGEDDEYEIEDRIQSEEDNPADRNSDDFVVQDLADVEQQYKSSESETNTPEPGNVDHAPSPEPPRPRTRITASSGEPSTLQWPDDYIYTAPDLSQARQFHTEHDEPPVRR